MKEITLGHLSRKYEYKGSKQGRGWLAWLGFLVLGIAASLPMIDSDELFLGIIDKLQVHQVIKIFLEGLVLVSIILLVRGKISVWRKKKGDKEGGRSFSVCVFPIGVQICQPGRPPLLLMSDTIHDCVVNEHILAHKVKNRLLVRLKNSQSVEAFPGSDLSYVDCLKLRNEIMKSFMDYGIGAD
mmetsp:Transcript_31057/g.64806  ORF Transcript_31057/g.64806 Transcript_31057/m.64806 type:complete len:184 (+) Transcript_31057:21-572(+)